MAVGDIVISVSADVSPLSAGAGKGISALAAMEKSGKRLEQQLLKIGEAGVAFQNQVNAFAGVANGIEKSARASAEAFAAFDDARASIDRLRASYDPLFAASKRYEAAVMELDDALEMGVITGTQHAQMLDRMGQAYLGAGTEVDRTRGVFGMFGNVSDATKAKIQNVGFQVQDFAVQVAGGTDATRAFAQQFPQLASALGPIGVAIGTLGAVAVPVLMAAFGNASGKAKDFASSVDALTEATRNLNEVAKTYSAQGLQDLIEKYGAINGEVLTLIENERKHAVALAQSTATEAINGLASEYSMLAINLDAVGQAAKGPQVAIYNLSKQLGLTENDVRTLIAAMQEAAKAKGFDEQAAALGKVNTILGRSTIAAGDLAGKALEAESNLRQLANTEPSANWLSAAIASAKDLYGYLFAAKTTNDALSSGLKIGASADSPIGTIEPPGVSAGTTEPATINVPGISGGGGSGGKQNQLVTDLEALQKSIATQADLENQAYAASQETLQSALDQRLISLQQYQTMAEDLQRQHQDRMSQIDVYRYGDGLQKAGQFFGDMANALQSGNERMQRIGRIFGAAEALVNTWRAYAQTMADPKLPFFAKFSAAAAVLSAGFNAVNAIKGGGGGSKSSAASVGSAPSIAAPQSFANITLIGDTFSRDSVESLFKQINDGLKQGRVINLVNA